MALQHVYLGSVGPYLYDDTLFYALRTTGQLRVETAPTDSMHVVRMSDMLAAASTGVDRVVEASETRVIPNTHSVIVSRYFDIQGILDLQGDAVLEVI